MNLTALHALRAARPDRVREVVHILREHDPDPTGLGLADAHCSGDLAALLGEIGWERVWDHPERPETMLEHPRTGDQAHVVHRDLYARPAAGVVALTTDTPTCSTSRVREVLTLLNEWEAKNAHLSEEGLSPAENPHDIWQEIITSLPDYDEETTAIVDPLDYQDRFALRNGPVISFDPETKVWHPDPDLAKAVCFLTSLPANRLIFTVRVAGAVAAATGRECLALDDGSLLCPACGSKDISCLDWDIRPGTITPTGKDRVSVDPADSEYRDLTLECLTCGIPVKAPQAHQFDY